MKSIPLSPGRQGEPSRERTSSQREGVTAEDVQRVVKKLTQEGVPVSLRTVRAELGTGSLSTVHKHLSAIRGAQATAQADVPTPLSPLVLRTLTAEVEKVVLERTAKLVAELKDTLTATELLADENESLRTSANEASDLLEMTRASLAGYSGTVDALRAQLTDVGAQHATAMAEAEAARQALAIAREQLLARDQRGTQMEVELRAARQEHVEQRQELRKSRQEAEDARGENVSLQAQLTSKQQVEVYLREAAAGAKQHQQQLEEAKLRLATLEVERTNLSERCTEMKGALSRAEGTVQKLMDKLLPGAPRIADDADAKA